MKNARMRFLATLAVLTGSAALFCVAAFDDGVARAPPTPPMRSDAECKLVPPDPSHMFIAAGVMHGDTLTNIQLRDADSPTTIVRVVIAPGEQPVTVFLSSEGYVIWDLEGAVDRVQRAIVAPWHRSGPVAVRGLPAERVEFPELDRCARRMFPPWPVMDRERDQAFDLYFGRRPDRVAFEGHPNLLHLPDARFELSAKGGRWGNGNQRDLLVYSPGGFRQISAASVVSRVAVLESETFPREAGLIQLEQANAIRAPRRDEIETLIEDMSRPYRFKLMANYRMPVHIDYVVTREIRLPPGLHGAHKRNFLVLAGVPAPRGSPGHGCVITMDGLRESGNGCKRVNPNVVERLEKWPLPADLQRCRALDLAADVSVQAVAVEDPGASEASTPVPIDLRVHKPGAIALVLHTWGQKTWRVSHGPETRIVGAILIGHRTSRIEGLEPNTPVVTFAHQGPVDYRKPEFACASAHGYFGPAHRAGPEVLLLDRQVHALTGRNLDGWRGAFRAREVEIR